MSPARQVGRDLVWVVGGFAVLGILGGVVWSQVAHPPYFVRTAQGAVMDQAELAKRISADGWFLAIGLVLGVLAGAVLMRRRSADPLFTLLTGTAAAVGAGYVALELGRLLGHVDVQAAVRAASVGGHVSDTLTVISPMVLLAWPLGFLLVAVGLLWGTAEPPPPSDRAAGATAGDLHKTDMAPPVRP